MIYNSYDHLPKSLLGEPSSFFVCNYNCCIKTWPGSKDPVLPAFQVGEWGATGQGGNQVFQIFLVSLLEGYCNDISIYINIYTYVMRGRTTND